MRLHGYPVIPMVLALILGPLAEENLVRALALGNDSLGYFFGSTVVNVLWVLLVGLIGYLAWSGVRGRQEKRTNATADQDEQLEKRPEG